MSTIVVIIHVLVAVVLVLTVLLQAGKGAGMGAAFGGSSGSVFGTRGPATLIGKITCGAAVIFMVTSLLLSLKQSGLETGSVMENYAPEPPAAAADSAAGPPAASAGPEAGAPAPAVPANAE
ncbi:MAG: preprotein translocase subunit SecG [Candidatus Adiutrix sp.]|jgi:preprotein translocase subunit SecG|nr:preprotein translocase subunit SecG [Candidatus Adiutrix sp.]